MRHAATQSLLERNDVVIVASVSCIYGIGSVETYSRMVIKLEVARSIARDTLARALAEQQYRRNDAGLPARHVPPARGDVWTSSRPITRTAPGSISLVRRRDRGDQRVRPADRRGTHGTLPEVHVYANSHYVTSAPNADAGGAATSRWS